MSPPFLTRFLFTYTLLNVFNYGIWLLPFGRQLRHLQMELTYPVVRFFGTTVLGMERVALPRVGTGSSDTSFDYAFMVLTLLLAAVIAAVWTYRYSRSWPNLERWLRVIVRYGLAGNMLAYGMVKVLPIQFAALSTHTMAQTYGASSPSQLLWSFMGYSQPYVFIAGALELLGALLLFRRTTLLGAIICAVLLLQVALLNLCYDVPVKLFSLHYLAASLYLIWPYRKQLIRFFCSGAASEGIQEPAAALPVFAGKWRPLLKATVIAGLVAMTVVKPALAHKPWARDSEVLAAKGVYDRVLGEGERIAAESIQRITIGKGGDMTLWNLSGAAGSAAIERNAAGALTAVFQLGDHTVELELFKQGGGYALANLPGETKPVLFAPEEPPLVSQGFRWINDDE